MNRHSPTDISDFLSWMAAQAVETQLVLDAGYQAASRGLDVPRMRLGAWQMEMELRLGVSSVEELRIGVIPLNLAYRVLHRDTEESDASVRIVVEQRALFQSTAQRDATPATFPGEPT